MIEYLGTIAATAAKNQTDTAAPFTIPQGERVVVQADAACHIAMLGTAAAAVTTATGLKLDTDEKFEFTVGQRLQYLSVVGAANLKVFRVYA